MPQLSFSYCYCLRIISFCLSITFGTSQEIKINRHPCESGGILEIECCKVSSYNGTLEFRDQTSDLLAFTDFSNTPTTFSSDYNVTIKSSTCVVIAFAMSGEGTYTCYMPNSYSVSVNTNACTAGKTANQISEFTETKSLSIGLIIGILCVGILVGAVGTAVVFFILIKKWKMFAEENKVEEAELGKERKDRKNSAKMEEKMQPA